MAPWTRPSSSSHLGRTSGCGRRGSSSSIAWRGGSPRPSTRSRRPPSCRRCGGGYRGRRRRERRYDCQRRHPKRHHNRDTTWTPNRRTGRQWGPNRAETSQTQPRITGQSTGCHPHPLPPSPPTLLAITLLPIEGYTTVPARAGRVERQALFHRHDHEGELVEAAADDHQQGDGGVHLDAEEISRNEAGDERQAPLAHSAKDQEEESEGPSQILASARPSLTWMSTCRVDLDVPGRAETGA